MLGFVSLCSLPGCMWQVPGGLCLCVCVNLLNCESFSLLTFSGLTNGSANRMLQNMACFSQCFRSRSLDPTAVNKEMERGGSEALLSLLQQHLPTCTRTWLRGIMWAAGSGPHGRQWSFKGFFYLGWLFLVGGMRIIHPFFIDQKSGTLLADSPARKQFPSESPTFQVVGCICRKGCWPLEKLSWDSYICERVNWDDSFEEILWVLAVPMQKGRARLKKLWLG